MKSPADSSVPTEVVARGPRLALRRFLSSDLEAVADLLGDPEVMRFSLMGVQDRAGAAAWLEKTMGSYAKTDWGHWAVVEDVAAGAGAGAGAGSVAGSGRIFGAGAVVGFCGLKAFDIEGTTEIEIGYRLRRRFWGRGYATEAAAAARHAAFELFALKRVIALIEPANVASMRVAEKIGLVREREIWLYGRDLWLYGENAE